MATKTVYNCDVCGSTDKDEAYRSDVKNFNTLSLNVNTSNADPMVGMKSQSIQICNDCIDTVLEELRTHFDKI